MDRSWIRYMLMGLPAIWLMLAAAPARDTHAERKLVADYVFIPAGSLGDSTVPEYYISSIEVTNREYRAFVRDLSDSGALTLLALARVDTARWLDTPYASPHMARCYYQQERYDDYPVVNISRQAAELYCDWLARRYNSASRQQVRICLPTEQQWMYAAMGGNPKAVYPWQGNKITYEKKGRYHGMMMCNCRVSGAAPFTGIPSAAPDTIDIIAPSRSYMPNTYEIYNMGGNVAEMISGPGYTKGGSYLSPAERVLISAHEQADPARGSPAIGFRPVMVMLATR